MQTRGADTPRKRRLVRALLLFAAAAIVAVAVVAVYCRSDKTAVFYAVRGDYAGFDIVEASATDDSTVRRVGLRNHRGETVCSAWVRRPHDLAPDYRIVLTYAGAKTDRRMLDLVPERPDLVLVTISYPYAAPRGTLGYLRWPYDIRRAAFRTVAGGMLAVSFLEHDERLDPHRLVALGVSLGSSFATIHAALDDRVPVVLLVHGGGDLPALVRANVRRPGLGLPAALLAEVAVDTFDPLHWAGRIAPRRLVMISSRDDVQFPPATAERLYAAAREPKEIHWTRTDHVRPKRADLVAELVREIEAFLAAPESNGPDSSGR